MTTRAAIEQLSAAISEDPAKAHAKNAPATARLVGGLRCEVSGFRDERFATDMPSAMGGGSAAPNPGWLLRAALASCSASVIAMRAARVGVELGSLEVTCESDSDLRGILGLDDGVPAGNQRVRMKVRIAAEGVSAGVLREIVAWADLHSPVNCTVRQAPAYSLEVEVLNHGDPR